MTMKKNDFNYKKALEQFLFDYRDGRYHNTAWLECKCPFCDMNSKKRHLNILMDRNHPLIFRCFRASCGRSGVVNKKMGRTLGITNSSLLEAIENDYLKSSKTKLVPSYYVNDFIEDYSYEVELHDLRDDTKEYFFKRTGIKVDKYKSLFRICDNITKFISDNKGRFNAKKLYYLTKLEESGNNFIYFFNDTYTMLYYRQINGDKKGKMSLVDNVYDRYIRHKPYYFSSDKNPKLYIAEGIFDIINTYFYTGNKKGSYIASNGFASTRNILFEFTKYIYLPDIVILSDNDVPIEKYQKFLRGQLDNRIRTLNILYNENDKDIGDIRSGIQYKKIRLK